MRAVFHFVLINLISGAGDEGKMKNCTGEKTGKVFVPSSTLKMKI